MISMKFEIKRFPPPPDSIPGLETSITLTKPEAQEFDSLEDAGRYCAHTTPANVPIQATDLETGQRYSLDRETGTLVPVPEDKHASAS